MSPVHILGWAEIRHPFHPLRGQRFKVLKKRRIGGVDTLILREMQLTVGSKVFVFQNTCLPGCDCEKTIIEFTFTIRSGPALPVHTRQQLITAPVSV
jgi:hypothetical protein